MSVILYRYDTSPYSAKIDHVLLLKNIPYERVTVANVLPRPEITDLLGVSHRRIPILAIGNDIYCDTSLIASALERRFPASDHYGTIFPNKKHGGGADTGLIKAFVSQWVDTVLFSQAIGLVPWEILPPGFVKDRETLIPGGHIDVEAAKAGRGKALSSLSTNLSLLEEQLADGRECNASPAPESLFDASTVPKSLEWLARMTSHLEHLQQSRPAVPELTGSDAAARIVAASFEPYAVVGFDAREGERLGLNAGDEVSITREDYATHIFGTVGKLVALNKEEFVLETKGSAGLVRCHFPRVVFTAKLCSELK
ncbi:Glutathione S-transferase [Mycena venus]|uniref:Glutathione S-transferase n=1 Tax=Mycena venus TaxID=2733690 RepID=A0A8H6Y736_9AGAR|nr:Glutathione S-transferase [Mycena venus]